MTFNANQLSVAFFGRTGVGKTSTINKLFRLNWEVGHGKAVTKGLIKKTVKVIFERQQYKILVIDTPGIAESTESDYLEIYKQAIETTNCIVWLYQADVRYFTPDQKALLELNPYVPKDVNFIIGLNQIDIIHPENWDVSSNQPSIEQQKNIPQKIKIVNEKLVKYIPASKVTTVAYSSRYSYGLDMLLGQIISVQRERTYA